MKFNLPLFAVKNLQVTRRFYETVLEQTVVLDLGPNISFAGFALQEQYGELVGTENFQVSFDKSNNHELYFEEVDYDRFLSHLKQFDDLAYVHKTKEYPWGQRVVRFYDPDNRVVEVGESMLSVFLRFQNEGMTLEQIAERTMHPVEFVTQLMAGLTPQ